jgi:hypothetical protein
VTLHIRNGSKMKKKTIILKREKLKNKETAVLEMSQHHLPALTSSIIKK